MDVWISSAAFDISIFDVVTYWSRDYVTISFMWIFELTNDICIAYCDIYLPRSCLFPLFGRLIWLWISELPRKHILIYYCGHLIWKTYEKAYPMVFHIQMYIRTSYVAFDISTFEGDLLVKGLCNNFFSGDIWTHYNDICITYCDIYLPRSCLFFSSCGHLIWLWISELPKKHLIYYYGYLTWKTFINSFELITNWASKTDLRVIKHIYTTESRLWI